MHRIQPKLFASLLLCVLAGTIGCAARDEADCPMPDREMRIGYGLGYAVRAEVIDGKTQAGEIKVFDYMSEKTWSRRVTYSDDNDYRGDIQRVACFQGKDNARPIVVVAFCGYSWGMGRSMRLIIRCLCLNWILTRRRCGWFGMSPMPVRAVIYIPRMRPGVRSIIPSLFLTLRCILARCFSSCSSAPRRTKSHR